MKKVGGEEHATEPTSDSKVGEYVPTPHGKQDAPPEEFTSIHPTDEEAEMMDLLEGPDEAFFEDHDSEKATRESPADLEHLGEEAEARQAKMSEVGQTNLTEGFGSQLKTYIKNQLLLKKEEDPNHVLALGDGSNLHRAGYAPNVGHLSSFKWEGEVGQGTLNWAGGSWDVWDYGDKLYPTGAWMGELLSLGIGEAGPEARQCLLLHCAAGYLHGKFKKVPSWEAVQQQTNEMRQELIQQASEASRHLGECPETMPRSEADLRVFVHDLLHWSHDKDYRTLASFPSGCLLDRTLHVVRMASDGFVNRGPLEVKDMNDDQWTDADLLEWLGPQAPMFHEALAKGLNFLEVYAGTARASQAVIKRGGTAIFLGLDHGQDFRRARDRSLARALVKRLKPEHLWGAFPCTPFCAWIRLAILRNCDMTLRLKEGRLHLKFMMDLCSLQVSDGREAHLENPLTSLAWTEPIALEALAAPHWLRARLDQCQTGLSSPSGGLHLKPTLIRTTDPMMQHTLSLTCPRLHDHDPVEGAATALSAMYSPHMADLIARVVLRQVGGGRELLFLLAVLEALWRVSRPEDVFKKGAELGSVVLKEAGGWEEANRGIRRTWVARRGDHFEGLHSDFFEGLVSPALLEKARENAIWGISARYEGGIGERVQCGPHPSLRERLEEAAQQLWKDAGKGRVLLCFDEGDEKLKGVVSVAMARVPKMLPDRTVSSKGRVIWDAKPINEFCDKSRHPPALIVWWQTRFPNTPILMSKKDVSDAFKWIPVRGPDTRLFAADLPGGEFGAPGKNITVLYNSLTFGWTGAPGEYMLFAWLIKSGHSMFKPPEGSWNDSVAFQSLVLMDDAVLIEPKIGLRPWMSVQTMETCTRKALGDGAINVAGTVVEGTACYAGVPASADATIDRVGAVDWSHKKAYSFDVAPYQRMIEHMEKEALDDASFPRRVSRPGDSIEDEAEDHGKLIVALTELLGVLLLAVSQREQWKGKVVLYMGDNQVVVRWINSRQARHPFAGYLLQVLAAIEACYGFHLHTAYLRTYHNVVADALTRKNAEEVIQAAGLEALAPPDEALQRFLDRAVCFTWRASEGYTAALLSSGAQLVEEGVDIPRRASCPGKPTLACLTLAKGDWQKSAKLLQKFLGSHGVNLVWADSRDQRSILEFEDLVRACGFATRTRAVCGRTLQDQVWWKRWVVTGSLRRELPFEWVTVEDEPCTPPLAGYPLEWLKDDASIDPDRWEKGLLKLDSSMPYLGATKPKPAGTLQRPQEGRALVWDPKKPMPGLHEGSCDPNRKDRLLLLGKGPDGPSARTILPEEVTQLSGTKKPGGGEDGHMAAIKALAQPPRSLCEMAVRWASSQADPKVGVCRLKWEEESRNILERWLQENPAQMSTVELPELLIHGSYRRHTASIQRKGLLRKSRELHFHDPRSASGKWRLDLETCVAIDVQRASALGCNFRKTGNDVWLCERDVPPEAIKSIEPWEDGPGVGCEQTRAGDTSSRPSRGSEAASSSSSRGDNRSLIPSQ
eukprot:s1182_g11.t1